MRTNLEGLLLPYTTPDNEDVPPAREFDYPDSQTLFGDTVPTGDEGEENLHSPEFHGVYE